MRRGDLRGGGELHRAAEEGQTDRLGNLLADGGDPDSTDRDGRTPLHVAAEAQQPDAARLLLESGGRVDHKDHRGRTPLTMALLTSHGGDGEVVRLLLAAGADPDLVDAMGLTPRGLSRTLAAYDLERFFD